MEASWSTKDPAVKIASPKALSTTITFPKPTFSKSASAVDDTGVYNVQVKVQELDPSPPGQSIGRDLSFLMSAPGTLEVKVILKGSPKTLPKEGGPTPKSPQNPA